MKTVGDGAFRREDLNSRSNDMTYSGALSFLRRKYSRDLTGVDVAVTGIPYDCATSNRPGARFGPRGIRSASTELASLDAFPFNFDPFKYLAVVDYGDVWLDYGYPQNVVEKVEKHADTILKQSTSLLSFGGDHFITRYMALFPLFTLTHIQTLGKTTAIGLIMDPCSCGPHGRESLFLKSQCKSEFGHKITVLMASTFCMLPGYILTEFRL